jgi:hypothetical protein
VIPPLKRLSSILCLLLLLLSATACNRASKSVPLSGAYKFTDGRLITIGLSEGDTLRFRDLQTGRSQRLYPEGDLEFHSGPGWASESPVNLRVRFERDSHGLRLSWTETGASPQTAVKLPLPEKTATFHSGDVDLYGKLVLPEGDGPFPRAGTPG